MIFKEVKVNDNLFRETWIREVEKQFPCSSYEYLTFGNTHNREKDYFLISTDESGKVKAVVYLSSLTHTIFGIFKLKVLTLGNQITNGLTFWFDNEKYSYKEFLHSLIKCIERNIKHHIVLLKDFKEAVDDDMIAINKELNFFNFNAFSRSYKFLDPTFKEYLTNLKSKKRMFLVKEVIKKSLYNKLLIKNKHKVKEDELKYLYQLYKNVSFNAKEIRIKAFPYSFFHRLNNHFKNINYTIVYENQNIIGFGLQLKHQDIVRCFCLGMDYKSVKKNNLWYVIVLNSILHSIENNCKKIELGNSNYTMKKKFVSIEEKIIFSIKLKNNNLSKILLPLLKKLVYKTFRTPNNN